MVHTNTNQTGLEITKSDITTTEWTRNTLDRFVVGPTGMTGIVGARKFGPPGRAKPENFSDESGEDFASGQSSRVSLRRDDCRIAADLDWHLKAPMDHKVNGNSALFLAEREGYFSRNPETCPIGSSFKLEEVHSRTTFMLIDPVSYVLDIVETCKRVLTTNLTNRTNKNDEKKSSKSVRAGLPICQITRK